MTPSLEYNTERNQLHIPEYGRHIQKLVEHCKSLATKEERNKMAHAIVGVMGNLNPHLRDIADFQDKLWQQLYVIADFDLDVDIPVELPTKEELLASPERMHYPQKRPKYRFYGNNIQNMINIASSWEKGDKREALTFTIANHMKKSYLNWNKDSVDDTVIFKHLFDMSDCEINLAVKDEDLRESKDLIHRNINSTSNSNHHRKNGRKNYYKNNKSNSKRRHK